jgi:hypothetical protein
MENSWQASFTKHPDADFEPTAEPLVSSSQREVVTQLRVLLRCHDVARQGSRTVMMRILAIAVGVLSVPFAIASGVFVFAVLEDAIDDEIATVVGVMIGFVFTGVGFILACVLWSLLGRGRGVPVPIDEQIQSIIHNHPERVRAWGGPAVLRMAELVEEILRGEEAKFDGVHVGTSPSVAE